MSKILAFLLAAFLAVSAVSARTTITTTVIEDYMESNPGQQKSSCEEQIHKQDNFNMCQKFLQEHCQKGSYYDLVMVTKGETAQKRDEQLKKCCKQMENVREECRCEGLSMMWKHQQQRVTPGQQEMQELRRMAENLPTMCELGPKECQIKTAMF